MQCKQQKVNISTRVETADQTADHATQQQKVDNKVDISTRARGGAQTGAHIPEQGSRYQATTDYESAGHQGGKNC